MRLGGINERQAAMLSIINNNPQTAFTIKELENRFAVSHPTVKADVDALVARGLLSKIIRYNSQISEKITNPLVKLLAIKLTA